MPAQPEERQRPAPPSPASMAAGTALDSMADVTPHASSSPPLRATPPLRFVRQFPIDGCSALRRRALLPMEATTASTVPSHVDVQPRAGCPAGASSPDEGGGGPVEPVPASAPAVTVQPNSSTSTAAGTADRRPPETGSGGFDPAAMFREAARAVASAVGEVAHHSSPLLPAAPSWLPTSPPAATAAAAADVAAILTPRELKVMRERPELADVDWKEVAWLRQRYFYTGTVYPSSSPQASQQQSMSSPQPESSAHVAQLASSLPSLSTAWFAGRRSASVSAEEKPSSCGSEGPALTAHGAGSLLWIVYGRAAHGRLPLKQQQQQQQSGAPTIKAKVPFLAPAMVPASLCDVEALMPGCLAGNERACEGMDNAPAHHRSTSTSSGSSGAGNGKARSDSASQPQSPWLLSAAMGSQAPELYFILAVCVYDGQFQHGGMHGSGRLTVFNRYALECEWHHGAPLLTETSDGSGAPCVLRSIVGHYATPLPTPPVARSCAGAGDKSTGAPVPAASIISFRQTCLGYCLHDAESDGAGGGPARVGGEGVAAGHCRPTHVTTTVFGTQYMGSLTVSMTVAATAIARHLPMFASAAESSIGGQRSDGKAGAVQDVLRAHWSAQGKLFWTQLMYFVPDGFGEMISSSADAAAAEAVGIASLHGPAAPRLPRLSTRAPGVEDGPNAGVCTGRYCGEWRGGRRHGFGVMWESASGTFYVGAFARDLRHGAGSLMVDATGAVFSGTWVKGVFEGPYSLTVSQRPAYVLQVAAPARVRSVNASSDAIAPAVPRATGGPAPYCVFDHGILLLSRHSQSGLLEPMFEELDELLTTLPPVPDRLLRLDSEPSPLASASGPPPPSDRRGPVTTLVSRQLDPIVLALITRPEWTATLARFQRILYFQFGGCPGSADDGAEVGGVETDAASTGHPLDSSRQWMRQLKARGARPMAAVGSTCSWCARVGLVTRCVPPCLQNGGSSSNGARPLTLYPAPLCAFRGATDEEAAALCADANVRRPCVHAFGPHRASTLGDSAGRPRELGGASACLPCGTGGESLATLRGLSSVAALGSAVHCLAGFISSLRLRLVSYIAAHPASCDVASHQQALLRLCWDIAYNAVAPLMHALGSAAAVVSGQGDGPSGTEIAQCITNELWRPFGVTSATTQDAPSLTAMYDAFQRCLDDIPSVTRHAGTTGADTQPAPAGARDLSVEEQVLVERCATLFCDPVGLSGVRAGGALPTTHGPYLYARAPALSPTSSVLGSALDSLSALVHQSLLKFPADELRQQQFLANCLLAAAAAVVKDGAVRGSAASQLSGGRDGTEQAGQRLRRAGFDPLSLLVQLYYALRAASPALPVPEVTRLLGEEMSELRANAIACDDCQRTPSRSPSPSAVSPEVFTLVAVARAMQRILHASPPPPPSHPGLHTACPETREPAALPDCLARTPLHELAMRVVLCASYCGAALCQRTIARSAGAALPPPAFAAGAQPFTEVTISSSLGAGDNGAASPSRHRPSAQAEARMDAVLRLTPDRMKEVLADFWAARGGQRERRVADRGQKDTSHDRVHARRHRDGTAPELAEWILRCIHEALRDCWPSTSSGSGASLEAAELGPRGRSVAADGQPSAVDKAGAERFEWRTFLYGSGSSTSHPRRRPHAPPSPGGGGGNPTAAAAASVPAHVPCPQRSDEEKRKETEKKKIAGGSTEATAPAVTHRALISEETFWYAQLLCCFLAREFRICAALHVRFRLGSDDADDDDDDDDDDNSDSTREKDSVRLSVAPAHEQREAVPHAAAQSGKQQQQQQRSPTSSSSSSSAPHACSSRGSPHPGSRAASCSPRPCKPFSTRSPGRSGGSAVVVGREVVLTLILPRGFAGSLWWELLLDRWTEVVVQLLGSDKA